MLEILSDFELYTDKTYDSEIVCHDCSDIKMGRGFWYYRSAIKNRKSLKCKYCKKDYTSYLPFIQLYLKMNP